MARALRGGRGSPPGRIAGEHELGEGVAGGGLARARERGALAKRQPAQCERSLCIQPTQRRAVCRGQARQCRFLQRAGPFDEARLNLRRRTGLWPSPGCARHDWNGGAPLARFLGRVTVGFIARIEDRVGKADNRRERKTACERIGGKDCGDQRRLEPMGCGEFLLELGNGGWCVTGERARCIEPREECRVRDGSACALSCQGNRQRVQRSIAWKARHLLLPPQELGVRHTVIERGIGDRAKLVIERIGGGEERTRVLRRERAGKRPMPAQCGRASQESTSAGCSMTPSAFQLKGSSSAPR